MLELNQLMQHQVTNNRFNLELILKLKLFLWKSCQNMF